MYKYLLNKCLSVCVGKLFKMKIFHFICLLKNDLYVGTYIDVQFAFQRLWLEKKTVMQKYTLIFRCLTTSKNYATATITK